MASNMPKRKIVYRVTVPPNGRSLSSTSFDETVIANDDRQAEAIIRSKYPNARINALSRNSFDDSSSSTSKSIRNPTPRNEETWDEETGAHDNFSDNYEYISSRSGTAAGLGGAIGIYFSEHKPFRKFCNKMKLSYPIALTGSLLSFYLILEEFFTRDRAGFFDFLAPPLVLILAFSIARYVKSNEGNVFGSLLDNSENFYQNLENIFNKHGEPQLKSDDAETKQNEDVESLTSDQENNIERIQNSESPIEAEKKNLENIENDGSQKTEKKSSFKLSYKALFSGIAGSVVISIAYQSLSLFFILLAISTYIARISYSRKNVD